MDDEGHKYVRVKGIRWFTNLDHKQRHEGLTLYKEYSPEVYPCYDNYDAIEVGETKNIPCDYYEVMGVPITFLDKFSPDQFELVAADFEVARPMSPSIPPEDYVHGGPAFYLKESDNEGHPYKRLVIKRK